MNRLQFLRGNYTAKSALRPPWSLVEKMFIEHCDRCDQCIQTCHRQIIKRGAAGFPEMNFSQASCDFCQQCVQVCASDALQLNEDNQHQPWSYKASINDQCFSARGIVCRSCGELCEVRAISFKLVIGGSADIQFNHNVCTGCGECVAICPANAIEITHVQQDSEEI